MELVEVNELKKFFLTPRGPLHAVDNVSFKIERQKTLGVVGESGCGKSTLGRVVINLLEPTSGTVKFNGKDISKYGRHEKKDIRKDMQIIFQDPYTSLDPRMSVRQIIAEPMLIHKLYKNAKDIDNRVAELMKTVGLDYRFFGSYPHELDGGRRQRIGIARALALNPKFIVCDEPVSALDVSIQAQILNLMMDLQESNDLTYLFITHDLSVVKHISNDIMVMYLGQCVEKSGSDTLFQNPFHPYTQALLSAIPMPYIREGTDKRGILRGEVTSPISPKPGCRFAARCCKALKHCGNEDPVFRQVGEGHFVACHLFD